MRAPDGPNDPTDSTGAAHTEGWAAAPFVGRAPELRAVEELMVRAGDRPWAAVIDGPAGIGKSRLLAELGERASGRGDRVVQGRATEFEQVVPFGLFLDTMDALPGLSTAAERTDDGRWAPSDVEQHRLYRRFREALHTLADQGPALWVVLDDVQWADEASLGLLEFLLHRPPTHRVGLVLAHRSGMCPPRLAHALARLARPPKRLRIPPLAPADLDLLLPHVRPGRRRILAEASAGNPLYLKLLADFPAPAVDALVGRTPAVEDAVAALMHDTIQADLSRLTPDERLVVQAAAVGGPEVGPDLAAAIAELPEERVLATLDRLTDRGILVAGDDRFGFGHPLQRAAAYRLAGPGWRIAAHRRAAVHLTRCQAPLMSRAQHLEHSLRPGDQATCAVLTEAAESALSSAPATSAHWFTKVLAALPHHQGTAELRVRIQLLLGRALLASGRLDAAGRVLQELLDRVGPHHRETITLLAQCNRIQGRSRPAYALLEATAADADGPDHALILIELATLDLMDGRVDLGLERARSLGRGQHAQDPVVHAAAGTFRALAAAGHGDIDRAGAELAAADRAVDAMPEDGLRRILDAVVPPLTWTAYLLEHHDRAMYCLDRAVRVARTYGHNYALPHLYTIQACTLTRLGRLGEALEAAEDAEESARTFGAGDMLAMARAVRLRALLWTEGPDAVRGPWEQTRRMPGPDSQWFALSVTTMLLDVGLQLGMDPPPDVGTLLDLHQDRQRDPMLPTRWSQAARFALASGRQDRAVQCADHAVTVAEEMGLSGQLGTALLARSRLADALKDPIAAGLDAARAAGCFEAAGQPIQVGQAHLWAAEVADHADRADDARTALGLARALFRTHGATWLETRAARAARQLAARRPARDGAGPPVLTERESQVAEFVAQGLTNQEIGARLFLSPRTVETHVTRLLAKLGVSSRAGIARRLAAGSTRDGSRSDARRDPPHTT
ncbi:helix-turn-helix transcriptional regulator [Embleya sp. AB8]|uniref:helix-turn-helix transcriptional regulator n=1 Tax=Embleya sp. AB8 TaxID=3156304 RepID=UPI003C789D80